MPPPAGQLRASRYFAALAVIVAGLYALVFFTGGGRPAPRLGLDLSGGTQVTLRAQTPNKQPPTAAQLAEAQRILAQRVNGLGVAEAEVVVQGNDTIVISAPGRRGEAIKQISQTAQLLFRQVVQEAPASGTPTAPSPSPSAAVRPSASPSASTAPKATPSVLKRGFTAALAAPTPTPSASPGRAASPTPSASPGNLANSLASAPPQLLMQLPQVTCALLAQRPPSAYDDPNKQIVACDQKGTTKYLLDKATVVGTDVSSASFDQDPQNLGAWRVNLSFTGKGQAKWTALTQKAFGATPPANQVAIVLDGKVVSAPAIQGVITGQAQITGNFTRTEAQDLANVLKYGALPLSFSTSEAFTISPTLGSGQLRAGLLAGGIGLVLVVLYSLLYYRALGLVTIASLMLSGAIVFAAVVILGRQIGFTLTLAGIAGFIVAVGITADSFVVFFERLKDEVKDGRSVRSSVPRAWVRARRTILSADTVSFLAAAALYWLSVGQVKGFAFTLGLSTLIDVLIVFLFTHPLVSVLSRSRAFESPRFTGLGRVRTAAVGPPAAARGTRVGTGAVKES